VDAVFRSAPYSQPNALAYAIEDAPYGATMAYPNLLPDQLADERDLAHKLGVQVIEVTEDPDESTAGRLALECAGRDCLYVVLPDGRMRIIRSGIGGGDTTHTMASAGADVIAAGHVLFGPTGRVVRWDHMSGHYRPHERQAREVAEAIFTLAQLRA
jgi:hypothetical protein